MASAIFLLLQRHDRGRQAQRKHGLFLPGHGGIQISKAGVAATLTMKYAVGFSLPSGLGFGLTAGFTLQLNTTSSPVTIGQTTLPATQAKIHATGRSELLGECGDLNGTFDLTVNSTSFTVGITANVTFLGATFTAHGFAGIFYDSHPGLALDITLSLPGGAQGIAPISVLGNNFVISGAFELRLEHLLGGARTR